MSDKQDRGTGSQGETGKQSGKGVLSDKKAFEGGAEDKLHHMGEGESPPDQKPGPARVGAAKPK